MRFKATVPVVLFAVSLSFCLALGGCAAPAPSRPAAAEPEEPGPVEQLSLTIVASSKLNWESKKPHPLVMCVYQLASPGPFSSKTQSREGIGQLLSCRSWDSSVLSYERITIQPRKRLRKTLHRMAGANYIGIAAGYYNYARGKSTVLFKIDNTAAQLYLGRYGMTLKKTGEARKLQ